MSPAAGRTGARGTTAVARRLLTAVDLTATGVFALQGALAGIVARLDVFGVLVIGLVTASGGGIMRDVLIGDVPPAALRMHRYLVAALAAGIAALLFNRAVGEIPSWLLTGLDAAGLALFAVAGTDKALQFGLLPAMAALMGTITAVGGGTLRDLLLGDIPGVLRIGVYAVAALLGSVIVVLLSRRRDVPMWAAMAAGAVATFALRVAAVANEWNLPVPAAAR